MPGLKDFIKKHVSEWMADVNKLLKDDADDTKKILHNLINPEKD